MFCVMQERLRFLRRLRLLCVHTPCCPCAGGNSVSVNLAVSMERSIELLQLARAELRGCRVENLVEPSSLEFPDHF